MPDPDDAASAAGTSGPAAAPPAATGDAPPAPAAGQDVPPLAPAPASPPPASALPAPGEAQEATFLERLPWWTVPALLVGVPLLVAVAVQVDPAVYDQFVWKYYWGPIKADAENVATLTHNGVEASSGYNVVNTLSWAALLGVCILGIAQMLATFRTPMDDQLIVAATAWVVVGSAAHVLEDAGLFRGWLQYLFITPPIYLLFGAFGIAAFLVGQWMKRMQRVADLHASLRLLWLLHCVAVLAWTALWLKGWPGIVAYVHPLWVAGFAVANFLAARAVTLRRGTVDPSLLTLVLSLGTYLLVGAYLVTYVVDPWNALADDGMPSSSITAPLLALAATAAVYALARKAPSAILGILLAGASGLAGAVAVALWNAVLVGRLGLPLPELHGLQALAGALAVAAGLGYRLWSAHRPQAAEVRAHVAVAYALGINLLLVFAQMLDAFATSIGIDLAGYHEKHVLSAAVIGAMCEFSGAEWVAVGSGHECMSDGGEWFPFGAAHPTFLGFAPVKLLVSLLVVYAIDVQSRDDAQRSPTMIGLVKFAIIMVGIGPGVRDFTRLSLGV